MVVTGVTSSDSRTDADMDMLWNEILKCKEVADGGLSMLSPFLVPTVVYDP